MLLAKLESAAHSSATALLSSPWSALPHVTTDLSPRSAANAQNAPACLVGLSWTGFTCSVSTSPLRNFASVIVFAPSRTSPEAFSSLPLPATRALRAHCCNVSTDASASTSREALLPLSKYTSKDSDTMLRRAVAAGRPEPTAYSIMCSNSHPKKNPKA